VRQRDIEQLIGDAYRVATAPLLQLEQRQMKPGFRLERRRGDGGGPIEVLACFFEPATKKRPNVSCRIQRGQTSSKRS
jgi:hypothetical protein